MTATSTDAELRKGRTLVLLGALVLGVGLAFGWPIAREMPRRYSGADIVMRAWMNNYNLVVSAAHALALALLLVGMWSVLPALPGRVLRWARRAGLTLLGVALATVIALMLFPVIAGSGPWPPDSGPVRAMRVLVFLPSVTRIIAIACVGVVAIRATPSSRLGWGMLALSAVDLVLAIQHWAATPWAVLACLHPCDTAPASLWPALLTTLALPWVLARRTPVPATG